MSFKICVSWTCIFKSCLVIVNSSYVSLILNWGYVAMRRVCYWLSFLLATSKELHSCEKRWLHWRGNHPFFFLAMGGVWFFLVLHMVVINKSLERMFFLWCFSSGDKKHNKLAKSGYKQNMKIKGLRISIHVFGYLLELNIELGKFFKNLNLVIRKPVEKMGWAPYFLLSFTMMFFICAKLIINK
jgi:hypothetical protein